MKKAYRFAKRIHTVVDTVYKLGRIIVLVPVLIQLTVHLVDGSFSV